MKKALVLSSGGVDSTTCLAIAIAEVGETNVTAVSVTYGQKHSKELIAAEMVADYYGVARRVLDLSETGIFDDSNCSLLRGSTEEILHESYAEQIEHDGEGMVRTYVPFRNGLMLSAVAALAMSLYPDDEVDIYLGAHADDAAGNAYADCSEEFVQNMFKAIEIGTYNKVHVKAPLVNMNKAEVIATGLKLHAPYKYTWSCYEGGDKPCGTCGTCIDRINAFRENGIEDPALDTLFVKNTMPTKVLSMGEYQKKAFTSLQSHTDKKDEVLNWVIGMSEEAGEVASLLKHEYWGGEPASKERVAEELGDELWYLTALASSFDIDLNEIAQRNLDKLAERHPDGFSNERSIKRHDIEKGESL